MAGIYGSLAQGIESGFGMAQRAAEFEEQKRHRKVLEDNQAAADMRASETHGITMRRLGQQLDEHEENRNYGAVQSRLTEVERQARAAQAAGGQIPPALAEEHGRLTGIMTDRAKRAAARLSPTAQTGNAPPTAEAEAAGASGGSGAASVIQQAKDFWSHAATGQVNPLDASGPELRMHLSAATGVKVDELPTVVDGVRDVQTGLQTGNNGLIVSGMNKAMLGRLRIGIGGPSPYGGSITRKEIIGLDPAIDANGQQHPNRFIPRLRVYVGGVSPIGEELYYDAPMTRKGSADKDDPVVAIDINKGLDWAGNVTMLGTLLQHPQIAAKVAGASGDDADKFVDNMRNLQNLTEPRPQRFTTKDGRIGFAYPDGTVRMADEVPAATPKPAPPAKRVERKNKDGTITTEEWDAQQQKYVPVPGTEGAPRTVKAKPAGGGNSDGAHRPPGNPNLTGDAYLATLSPTVAAQVKALDAGSTTIDKYSTRAGERKKMLDAWFQYNPNATTRTGKTGESTERAFATGVEGRKVRALSVAIEHIDVLTEMATALHNKDMPRYNQLANWFKHEFGKEAPNNFNLVRDILADEVVAAVVPGVGALADRKKAADTIRNSFSPEQITGATTGYIKLLAGQLVGMRQQYVAGNGQKDFDSTFLTPRARDAFRKYGGATTTPNAAPATAPAGGPYSDAEKERRYQAWKAQQAGR